MPVNQIHETEYRWFAIHTRVKCEKAVAGALAKKQIAAYVPLVRVIRRYERKIRRAELPLISCYVFVRITKNDYIPVLETEHVAGFVRFANDILAIPDDEINVLRRIVLESDIDLEAVAGQVRPGDQVLVTAGPLTGLQGIVTDIQGKKRLQVELQRLGYTLLMSIDATFLQKL